MNNNYIFALNGDTGAAVYPGGGSSVCRGVRQWTSPIVTKGRVVVAGDNNLCSWSVPH